MRWITLVVCLSACIFPKPDGAPCSDDSQCDSGFCYINICGGSDCGDSRTCEDGWECVYDDGDPIFGFGDGYQCIQRCTVDDDCAELWACSGSTCSYRGPALEIEVTPMTPRRGDSVHFHAQLEPATSGTTFTWSFHQWAFNGSEIPAFEMTGADVDVDFPAGQVSWQVTASSKHDTKFEHGIFDVCGLAGDVCSPFGGNDDCCAGLTCDADLGTCVAAP